MCMGSDNVTFEIIFTLDESFGPLKKRVEEAIIEGKEHGYSNEAIIDTALSEYDVSIRCQGKEFFDATVSFSEFLHELFRFAFYALTGEVPAELKSQGWSFNGLNELPKWLDSEVKILRELLGNDFEEATSRSFLRSFFGSYDPRLVVYGFRKGGYIYLVSVDYRKVCRVPISEFVEETRRVIERALQELGTCTHLFEREGIREFQEILSKYDKLLKRLKNLSRGIV